MKYSLLNHFSVIEPCISPSLMDKASIDSVKELCALFPFDIANDFGFESRLGNREAYCDFMLQIKKGSKGALILAEQDPISHLDDLLLENPFWKKISHLLLPGIILITYSLVWLLTSGLNLTGRKLHII